MDVANWWFFWYSYRSGLMCTEYELVSRFLMKCGESLALSLDFFKYFLNFKNELIQSDLDETLKLYPPNTVLVTWTNKQPAKATTVRPIMGKQMEVAQLRVHLRAVLFITARNSILYMFLYKTIFVFAMLWSCCSLTCQHNESKFSCRRVGV